MTPPKAGRVKITLRLDQLDVFMTVAGIGSNAELVRRMDSGVAESTISRLRRGIVTPNAGIIAGLLTAFPGVRFEQLFTITDEDTQVAA